MPEQAIRHYVGLDIAKDKLDYALTDTACGEVPNSAAGHAALIAKLRALPHPPRVVCEATGGYEKALVEALLAAGIEVCLVQPGRVRAFAYAEGLLAKTDRIDARLLRRFGQAIQPRRYTPAPAEASALRELLEYRQLLVAQLAELSSRQETAGPVLQPLLAQLQQTLKQALEKTEQRLHAHVHEHHILRQKAQRLQQLQGVGPVLAHSLLAYVPELGHIADKSLSALLGVAPHPNDSAHSSRPRHVRGGRAVVRRVLYMAAVCAARFNPILRVFYQRLRARGKPPMVALVALMRRMLCVLNRMLAEPTFSLAS